jgi:hypothetical protein
MADADDVRRLALALPGVEEIDSDGFDFRVGGKGFVWSYPERRPGQRRVIRSDIAVLFVGDQAEKQALLLGEPGLFFTAPGYDGWPLVMLRLAEVDLPRLAELVTDAWRMRAPASLAGAGPGRGRSPVSQRLLARLPADGLPEQVGVAVVARSLLRRLRSPVLIGLRPAHGIASRNAHRPARGGRPHRLPRWAFPAGRMTTAPPPSAGCGPRSGRHCGAATVPRWRRCARP